MCFRVATNPFDWKKLSKAYVTPSISIEIRSVSNETLFILIIGNPQYLLLRIKTIFCDTNFDMKYLLC